MKWEELFNEVAEISKANNADVAKNLCKLAEEHGELAQGINKFLGIKNFKPAETEEQVRLNILEEIADNVQILFFFASHFGHSIQDVKSELKKKNKDYREKYAKKNTAIA